MVRYFFTFFVVLLLAAQVLGQTPSDRMREANDAYLSKQYQPAAEIYEALLGDGYASAALHYNLGNSYYRLGELAPAILHYERALRYRPHDRDIRHNLSVAREQLPDELDVLPEFFLRRWWRSGAFALSAVSWSVLGLIMLWLGVAGLVVWLFASERRQRKRGFITGLVLLCLCILPFAMASSRVKLQEDSGMAILMTPEIVLRSAPDEQSAEVLTIHAGLKVELLDQISDWYKVRLQNGEEGWLPEQVLEEI